VICEIGPATVVVEQASTIARSVVEALAQWVGTSWD
jgi:hypothetical protein